MSPSYSRPAPTRRWLLGMALLCVAAVVTALVSQHGFDMQPCPWCVLQRLLFIVIGALALLAAWLPPRAPRAALASVALLLALAGAMAALYQHFVAAKSQSCNLTLADRIVGGLGLDHLLPPVFQVTASCAEAAVDLLGVPYDFWSAALFALLAFGAAMAATRALRNNL